MSWVTQTVDLVVSALEYGSLRTQSLKVGVPWGLWGRLYPLSPSVAVCRYWVVLWSIILMYHSFRVLVRLNLPTSLSLSLSPPSLFLSVFVSVFLPLSLYLCHLSHLLSFCSFPFLSPPQKSYYMTILEWYPSRVWIILILSLMTLFLNKLHACYICEQVFKLKILNL